MVRAAATGAIDFAKADLDDKWWWRRLGWILDELETSGLRQVYAARHMHYITTHSNASLNEESFDKTAEFAAENLQRMTVSLFPWLEEELAKAPTSHIDEAVSWFREEYGEPSDPRYQAMLATIDELFSRKKDAA